MFIESFNIWYVGQGVLMPIKNSILSIYRKLLIKIQGDKYSGLFPGDITYKANKVSSASVGYAHLPNIFEIRRYLPSPRIRSIYQIIGIKKHDLLKPFRYSIWIEGKTK